jgi:serine/threonine-protein kinase
MQLLEKEPSKRPRSAGDVVRALEDPAVVSGTFTPPALPSAQRPKRVLWALAGAGILASVAAGGAWFSNHRAANGSSGANGTPATSAALPATAGKSIAVIPLVNISRDTSDAYFAAGMTSDLSNALSRIPGVRVAGAESAARDQASSPTELGKTLGVNMVLTGTVQRDKTRLRVTARLVNTADGFTIWSDMFERDSKDVFKVQDDISNAIVAAISPELSGGGTAAAPASPSAPTPGANGAAPHGTSDLLAYDLYLRGKYFFDKRGETGLRRSLDYFRQATQRDSNFARAYAGIANAYALLPLYANVRVDSIMPLAMAAIDRAVRLDSTLAEAFASRATLLQAAWRWSDAERDYRRAINLDANAAQPHQWYGELLLVLGRTPESRVQLARATQLDPLAPVALGSYALALAVAHQSDSAVALGRRAVELDSTLVVTRFMLGGVELEANRIPDAIVQLEAATRLDTASMTAAGLLGYAYARSGKTRQATDIAKGLERQIGRSAGAAAAAARVYIGLGDKARALTLLERAATDRDSFFSSESLAESFFDPIRSDPRFAALVSRVGVGPGLLAR